MKLKVFQGLKLCPPHNLLVLLAMGLSACAGKTGPVGPAGPPGEAGEVGPKGKDGAQGAPGEGGQNGQDGSDGQDGEDGLFEVINLCPEVYGSYPEILIRTKDGLFGVSYQKKASDPGYLTRKEPGEYKTSDGRDCEYTVTEELEVIYE